MNVNYEPRVLECLRVINGEIGFEKERDLDITFVKVVIDSYIKRIVSSEGEPRCACLSHWTCFVIARAREPNSRG